MAALLFNKCCGCIELKTGCFLIGYLNLVVLIIMNILTIVGLTAGAVVVNQSDEKEDGLRETGIVLTVFLAIALIVLLAALAFAIVLLVGLHQNKPGHLKAYLIFSAIFTVLSIIQFIFALAKSMASFSSMMQNIFSILLGIYFLLVIRSMYFRMKDSCKAPATYTTA